MNNKLATFYFFYFTQ